MFDDIFQHFVVLCREQREGHTTIQGTGVEMDDLRMKFDAVCQAYRDCDPLLLTTELTHLALQASRVAHAATAKPPYARMLSS